MSNSFEAVTKKPGRTGVDRVRDQCVEKRIRSESERGYASSHTVTKGGDVLPHARPTPVQEEDEGASEDDVRDNREAVRDCREPLIGRTRAAVMSAPLHTGPVDLTHRAFCPGGKATCLKSAEAYSQSMSGSGGWDVEILTRLRS